VRAKAKAFIAADPATRTSTALLPKVSPFAPSKPPTNAAAGSYARTASRMRCSIRRASFLVARRDYAHHPLGFGVVCARCSGQDFLGAGSQLFGEP